MVSAQEPHTKHRHEESKQSFKYFKLRGKGVYVLIKVFINYMGPEKYLFTASRKGFHERIVGSPKGPRADGLLGPDPLALLTAS